MADLSVKKLRAAALRDKECAIAMSQAALIFLRFLPGLPPAWFPRSMVAFEAWLSAAVAVCALTWPFSLMP